MLTQEKKKTIEANFKQVYPKFNAVLSKHTGLKVKFEKIKDYKILEYSVDYRDVKKRNALIENGFEQELLKGILKFGYLYRKLPIQKKDSVEIHQCEFVTKEELSEEERENLKSYWKDEPIFLQVFGILDEDFSKNNL